MILAVLAAYASWLILSDLRPEPMELIPMPPVDDAPPADDAPADEVAPIDPPAPIDPTPPQPAPSPKVRAGDVIAKGFAADKAVGDLEQAQARINADLATAYKAQEDADAGISRILGNYPDGILSKDADGNLALFTKTNAGKGFNITHPATDDLLVDLPGAPPAA